MEKLGSGIIKETQDYKIKIIKTSSGNSFYECVIERQEKITAELSIISVGNNISVLPVFRNYPTEFDEMGILIQSFAEYCSNCELEWKRDNSVFNVINVFYYTSYKPCANIIENAGIYMYGEYIRFLIGRYNLDNYSYHLETIMHYKGHFTHIKTYSSK